MPMPACIRELLPCSGLIGGLTLALIPVTAGVTVAEAQTRPTRELPGSTPPATAQEKPVILVDLGHGQTFFQTEPGRETPIGLSYRGMAQYLGAELRVTTEPLSAETLKSVRTLLIFGPLEPIEAAEVQAVTEFVKQGGGLIIGTDEDRRQSLAKTRANDSSLDWKRS